MKIREIIQTLFPTRTWKLAAIIAGGVLCGLGSYTLYASRAWTYLSDDPATCVNCHIMGPYYATWNHSSHSRNATCNDCHVPHENAEVIMNNCIRCHTQLNTEFVNTGRIDHEMAMAGEGKACWDCHREVPHGGTNSLSSTPNALVPYPKSVSPDWLKDMLSK